MVLRWDGCCRDSPSEKDHEPCSRRDAASVLLSLSGYRVVEAIDGLLGNRKVVIEGYSQFDVMTRS